MSGAPQHQVAFLVLRDFILISLYLSPDLNRSSY
jgi:hypothetical protein